MAEDEHVTTGEIARRLDRLDQKIDYLSKDLRGQIATAGSMFVTKEVFEVERRSLDRKIDRSIEKCEETNESLKWFRRQAITAGLALLIAVVGPLILLAVNLKG